MSAVSAQLLDLIDRDRLTRTLVELIATPSVNPFDEVALTPEMGEIAAATYVRDRLNALGWAGDVDRYQPDRANVLATAPRPGPARRKAIVLAGHLDTVQVDGYDEPFTARVEAGRVHGRGACDMKAAIACYLEVAEVLAQARVVLNGDLIIAGVGDEEYHQDGAKAARQRLPDAELVVIGEPTELKVCTAAKGLAAYTLAVDGLATHGSVPDAGSNAIVGAARLLEPIVAHAQDLAGAPHALLGPGVLNIGVIRGGLKPNIVPSSCEVEISRRLLPNETPQSARDLLNRRLRLCACDNPWRLSDAWWAVDPYENHDQAAITAFQAAVTTAGGGDASLHGFPASSDAAYFGAPVVIFGPGSLAQAHSLDEWVAVDDMIAACRTYLQFVLDRLGQAHAE